MFLHFYQHSHALLRYWQLNIFLFNIVYWSNLPEFFQLYSSQLSKLNPCSEHILYEIFELWTADFHYFWNIAQQWKHIVPSCNAPFLLTLNYQLSLSFSFLFLSFFFFFFFFFNKAANTLLYERWQIQILFWDTLFIYLFFYDFSP